MGEVERWREVEGGGGRWRERGREREVEREVEREQGKGGGKGKETVKCVSSS